jgi:hypothetical protein
MVHRLLILWITGFWLAMTSLLVVRELYPEATRLNAVPVGYVGQIIFQHEQASDLGIFSSGKDPIGFLHIQPKTFASTGKRAIEFHGNLNLTLLGKSPQHISWFAVADLSREFALERLHLDLSTPGAGQHLDVVVDLVAKTAAFGAKVGNQIVNETAFTLDEAGFGKLMAQVGVDPMMMRQLKASQGELPQMEFGAQSSSTVLSGQKLSTFLLTLKAGGQTVCEAQLSQLGQVLTAHAPVLGWKLVPSSLPR